MIYRRGPRPTGDAESIINADGRDPTPALAFATVQQHAVETAFKQIADMLASGYEPGRYFVIDSLPKPEKRS